MDIMQFRNIAVPSRRAFLSSSGLGLLAGSSRLSGVGLAESILTPDPDQYQSISLTTHEWFGDTDERLDLPRDWGVDTQHMAGHNKPVLSAEDIRQRINQPYDTKTIRDIAAGKRTAVIIFDDITRATPAHVVAPVIIDELKAGGIKDEHILFVCMLGTHRGATQPEIRAKLGDAIVDRYPWINHNCHDNFIELGRTSQNNLIKINHYVMQADIKISISGIKTHGHPGYSGGAKAILPGVASLDSIQYMHGTIPGVPGNRNPTVGKGRIYHNDCRHDMEEAARMAGLDFTVQLIINGRREIIGLYAGDVVEAFRPAVHYANKQYRTDIAQEADVVIVNCYPRNMQEYGFQWANRSLKPGGTAIVIWQHPLGKYTLHYWNERRDYNAKSFWDNRRVADPLENAGRLIIFSQYINQREMQRYVPDKVHLVRSWGDVLTMLHKWHGPSTRVAVYPYAGLQHEPIALDSA